MSDRSQPSLMKNAATTASPATVRTQMARRPTTAAIVTTLLWNAGIAIGLGAWFLIASLTAPKPSDAGEDWNGVILVILVAIVGTAIAVGAASGAATAAVLIGRRLRRASAQGQPGVSMRTAILVGSAGAGIGWLIGFSAAALVVGALAGLPLLVQ